MTGRAARIGSSALSVSGLLGLAVSTLLAATDPSPVVDWAMGWSLFVAFAGFTGVLFAAEMDS